MLRHECILDSKDLLDCLPLQESGVPPVSPHSSHQSRDCQLERRENSLGGKWEVLLEIQAFDLQPGRCALVPRDECQICNGRPIFDEVARRTLGEDRLQHAKHAFNLVVVPLNRAGNLLGVEFLEPRGLAEVRSV